MPKEPEEPFTTIGDEDLPEDKDNIGEAESDVDIASEWSEPQQRDDEKKAVQERYEARMEKLKKVGEEIAEKFGVSRKRLDYASVAEYAGLGGLTEESRKRFQGLLDAYNKKKAEITEQRNQELEASEKKKVKKMEDEIQGI